MKKNTAFKKTHTFIKSLILRIKNDEVSALGAQFAYHLIMSLFPFLLFLATLATYAPVSAEDALIELSSIVPPEALKVLKHTLNEISGTNRPNVLSLSMLVTIYLASNGFAALTRGLNKAYDVTETRGFFKVRILSLLFVPLVSLGILIEATAVIFGNVILCRLSDVFCRSAGRLAMVQVLRILFPFLTMVLIFSLLYMEIPNKKLTFRQSLPGAAFSSAAWFLASFAFSFYVNRFADYSRLYGSLGGVMILFIWLYLTSIVLLIGSEINAEFDIVRKKTAPSGGERNMPE